MEEFNEIARTISKNTKKVASDSAINNGFDIGTITSTGLKLDNFKYEIKDYSLLDYLKLDSNYMSNTTSTDHSHNVITPNSLKPIKIGDRVLVATVGNEFIVVGRIVNA